MRRIAVLAVVALSTSAAPFAQEASGRAAAQTPVTVTNSIGMEFVLVQPGSMLVGVFAPRCPTPPAPAAAPAAGPAGGAGGGTGGGAGAAAQRDPRTVWAAADYARCEEMALRDALPGFTVRIDRPFYMGKYEVTQAQWRRVMGNNPSIFQGAKVTDDADFHPVDNVTWEDAQEFIRRLNTMDPSARYRLPTEFEWEYAARGGAEGEPTWATIRASAWLNLVDKGTTRPVGGKTPNAYGLYDMLGNVWEWVEDFYNEKLYADPSPPRTGQVHVLRGGGFHADVKNTNWVTHAGGPGNGYDVGFRVVREAN